MKYKVEEVTKEKFYKNNDGQIYPDVIEYSQEEEDNYMRKGLAAFVVNENKDAAIILRMEHVYPLNNEIAKEGLKHFNNEFHSECNRLKGFEIDPEKVDEESGFTVYKLVD